jgi:hypothetical protein
MKPNPLPLLFTVAVAATGFAQQAPQPSSAQAWQQTQKTDEARAMTFTRYTLAGKFLAPPKDAAADRPTMAVDCIPGVQSHSDNGKFLAANLLVGTPLKIIYVEPEEIHGTSYFQKVTVRYHTDQGKPEEDRWSPAADKTSVSVPKDALKRFLHGRTLAITARDGHGSPVAMQFDMPDATLVEDACDVK